MRYQEALICWIPGTEHVRVGPLIRSAAAPVNWTRDPVNYTRSGGAKDLALRECQDPFKRDMMLFIEFHTIVVRDQVPVAAAHAAFLAIDEYRQRIAPDIPGADQTDDTLGGW